jgi:hypothetical protein
MAYDPRYFTTYYAIDAINFTPVDTSSALNTLEGPYLPLVVQEGGRIAARSVVCRTKENSPALQGTVFRLRQRCGS